LNTYYYIDDRVHKALDNVSFTLKEGETLGVVGSSGAGKSVLARSIMGLIQSPGRIINSEIVFRDRNLLDLDEVEMNKIRGKDISLIVAPARSRLNPLLSIGKQMSNVISAKQDISKKEAIDKVLRLLEAVQISDPIRISKMLPVELSGGMCQRVVIAMAISNSPQLILADEPITGLDVTVQLQVLELLMKLVNEQRSALLLMTRDLGVVAHFAERICVLDQGCVVELKETKEFFRNPEHPQSKKLLDAAFASRGEE
jgi:peptide/nickel transport system ATP-binding protein